MSLISYMDWGEGDMKPQTFSTMPLNIPARNFFCRKLFALYNKRFLRKIPTLLLLLHNVIIVNTRKIKFLNPCEHDVTPVKYT